MPKLTPLPDPITTPLTLKFSDAIEKIVEGKRVTRIAWENKDYCLLKDGWLSIYTKDDFHIWKVNDGDMEATDWVEIVMN